jgi:ribosomal protein S14
VVSACPMHGAWAQAGTDPDPAMNHADQVSWTLFAEVVAPAYSPGNHDVRFETWASDNDTFTEPPRWPGTTPSAKKLHREILMAPNSPAASTAPGPQNGKGEEVRRNEPAFRFIVDNQLYNEAGLVKAFAAGQPIDFPVDAIEVKADWVLAEGSGRDESLYYSNIASDHEKYLLVALHIISKQVPNWTWATFEHADNPGRCDSLGCRDGFGAKQAWVPPRSGKPGQQYSACEKTPQVLAIFRKFNLADVFRNYCLKGSQTGFVDPTGLPTRLGNSVTEKGFVNTASCITCHSRAGFDRNGRNIFGTGLIKAALNPVSCPTGEQCSPNGPPRPQWFWSNPDTPLQVRKMLQADFVWSIPTCVIPKGKTMGPCS